MLARMTTLGAMTLAMGACSPLISQQEPPAPAPQAPAPIAEGQPISPEAEAVLDRLEASGSKLLAFASELRHTKTFALDSDMHQRLGRLYYRAPDAEGNPPTKRFAIHFEKQVLDPANGGRLDNFRKSFVFDGEWLCELDHDEKTAVRRQVVEPGRPFDPLRLGEGPFPIPLGQRKQDILARFDVSLRETNESLRADDPAAFPELPPEMLEAQRGFVESCTQLLLTPRPEFQSQSDYTEIRFWLLDTGSEVLIPRMVRTVNRSRDVAIVQLIDPKINDVGAIPEAALSTFPPGDWTLREEPWVGRIEEAR